MFLLSGAAVLGMFTTILLTFLVIAAIGMGAAAGENQDTQFSSEKLEYGKESASSKFLIVDVKGVIMGDPAGLSGLEALFTEGLTYGYQVKEQLMRAADENKVAGVVLTVDSPGGTIFGSQAIADGVLYYKRATGKPVVTYVAGMAASGGFWSAIASDEVIADHGTSVGSIGVIFGPFKYYDKVVEEDGGAFLGGVVTQGGIETTYITAGRSKDIGNPYRKLTEQEIAQLQASVNDSYEKFVEHVSERRKITPEKIRTEIGAMIFSETQAQKLGLIDKIGSKHAAYAEVARLANIAEGDYKMIRQHSPDDFFSAVMGVIQNTKASPTAAVQLCTLHSQVLAFHGSVSSLCE